MIFSNLDTLFIFLECFFFQITKEYSYQCIAEPAVESYHIVSHSFIFTVEIPSTVFKLYLNCRYNLLSVSALS